MTTTIKSKKIARSKGPENGRISVKKTYKLYINGKFPRTESGRFFPYKKGNELVANICRASRKDLRESVVAARKAQGSWSNRSAFNRSQIIYRIAEMLEGRKAQFIEELMLQGSTKTEAHKEISISIDRLIYYAGWADKFQQIFSSVNPVSSSHFNFSIYEPTGVVFIFADKATSLLSLVSSVTPVIASGNTCIVLASDKKPLSAITFGEVIHSSDVPGGVVNILTGYPDELLKHAGGHLDINSVFYAGKDKNELSTLKELAAINVKRVVADDRNWMEEDSQDPYLITKFCEVKTTWHPIEKIGPSGSGY